MRFDETFFHMFGSNQAGLTVNKDHIIDPYNGITIGIIIFHTDLSFLS
ncbi:MAG: hypothetical protein JXB88_01375 [Spirochaetales bacterium]|nr:hypothetical protein [Spirochaetales bacterium]